MTTSLPSNLRAPATGLGASLERRRLEHRAARIEHVLGALRDRAVYRADAGEVPVPLTQAIAGFTEELARIRVRLAAMPHDRGSS